jgi:adenosylcobyric acid synthase
VAKTIVTALYKEKGLNYEEVSGLDVHTYKEQQYDLLARGIRENIDMKRIFEIIERGVSFG